MLRFLVKLKPLHLKAAIKIMMEARAGVCAVSKLDAEIGIAEKMAKVLEPLGLIQVNSDLGEPMAVLCKPFAEFVSHVQAFAPQLSLDGFEEPPPPEKKRTKRDDMNAVMEHYATAKGFTGETKTKFIRKMYPRCATALVSLLSEAGSAARACEVIDAVKMKMEKKDLDWSLNGAVLNHMHGALAAEPRGEKGGWDW